MVNGRLPDSILTPIPGGARMRKDAAFYLKAENVRLRQRGDHVGVIANGPLAGYRTLAGQVLMRQQWCSRGACQNAAVPGTSNHGWGIALDSNQGWKLDGHGGPFDKRCSDAPWESWHRRCCRVSATSYNSAVAARVNPYPTIRRGGGHNPHLAVIRLQKWLKALGLLRKVTGSFGVGTERAVKRFQKKHGLKADGIVGPTTWKALDRRVHHK